MPLPFLPVHAAHPPLRVVCRFAHLLNQSQEDFLAEAELLKLQEEVVWKIRSNQQLQQDLNLMDIKIGLLVKNRVTLQVRGRPTVAGMSCVPCLSGAGESRRAGRHSPGVKGEGFLLLLLLPRDGCGLPASSPSLPPPWGAGGVCALCPGSAEQHASLQTRGDAEEHVFRLGRQSSKTPQT